MSSIQYGQECAAEGYARTYENPADPKRAEERKKFQERQKDSNPCRWDVASNIARFA
jgi:hypothetical protein